MTTFDNALFEELFNGLFTEENEKRLKIVHYEIGGMLPQMYVNDTQYVPMYEEHIAKMERDIAKAKKAMALFQLMREAGVGYTPEND